MPKNGSADFVVDPLSFMESNIVVVTMGNMDPGVKAVSLIEFSDAAGKLHGKTLTVYKLVEREKNDLGAGFLAYWCPYKNDSIHSVMLGNMAKFMFTPQMDGCSLGIGTQSNGVCRVAHVNTAKYGEDLEGSLGVDAARGEQRKLQKNLLIGELGKNVQIVSPDTYMRDADNSLCLKATTFGFHNVNYDWRIYTQRYWKPPGNDYFHRGVHKEI